MVPIRLRCAWVVVGARAALGQPPQAGKYSSAGYAVIEARDEKVEMRDWSSTFFDRIARADFRRCCARRRTTRPARRRVRSGVPSGAAWWGIRTGGAVLKREASGEYWRAISYQSPADYAKVKVPSLAISGWFDANFPGTPMNYLAMKRHGGTPGGRKGDITDIGGK